MNQKNPSNLLIYRVRENGLEVFMVKDEHGNDVLPQSGVSSKTLALGLDSVDKLIQLEATHEGTRNMAVEADWHEIPTLKSLIAQDVNFLSTTIKQIVPDMMEKGTYFAVKEAIKRVLPSQYSVLKELKDIIIERNSSKF